MNSKLSSPSSDVVARPSPKQARSKKAVEQPAPREGRAGSVGGVVLDGEKQPETNSTAKVPTNIAKNVVPGSTSAVNKPRRKPRKLNQNPAPVPTKQEITATNAKCSTVSQDAASDLDALKARVRGLEAKVEELYKSNSADSHQTRPPRRRGKGKKTSASTDIKTIQSMAGDAGGERDVIHEAGTTEGMEELDRLQRELDSARQDLQLYRPRNRRSASSETEDIEEIMREGIGSTNGRSGGERQVTFSGSYRIPIPANVSADDINRIQSGVTAAQNVARSFLEQRRAAAPCTEQPPQLEPYPLRSTDSNQQGMVQENVGKKSWGEWIGGYSMAISRAVSKIEHEAAVESRGMGYGRAPPPSTIKKADAKRPSAKVKLSAEQIDGLMR